MGIQDAYVLGPPTPQGAVDLFRGEWASRLPDELGAEAGEAGLFDDVRVEWAIDAFGPVTGADILELGPLEGGHTFGLLRAGAASVTAVEAAPRAWLRCLVAKELLGMDGASFLLGGADAYLEQAERRFDVGWCSGLLYHLDDPARLLVRLASLTDRLFIWTHVYDPEVVAADADLATQFDGSVRTIDVGGTKVDLHRHDYQHATASDAFCGGDRPDSWWLTREGLLAVLQRCGFADASIGLDHRDHPNGAALAIAATRTGPVLPPAAAGYPPGQQASPSSRRGVAALPSPTAMAGLQVEVAQLQDRLAAIEATRTWRLHSFITRNLARVRRRLARLRDRTSASGT